MNTDNIGDGEMREHFERIITKFVDLSQQARELEQIKAQVAEMANRLQEFGLTNSSLRSEIAQAWDSVRQVEQDRDNYRSRVETLEVEARQLAAGHDMVVSDLRGQVADAQNGIAHRDQTIVDLRSALAEMERQRNVEYQRAENLGNGLAHWQSRAETLETALGEAQGTNRSLAEQVRGLLDQVSDLEAKLARVRSVFDAVSPLTAVA